MKEKEDALQRADEVVTWFMRDLIFSAPELYEEKWKRFRQLMKQFVEEIYS